MRGFGRGYGYPMGGRPSKLWTPADYTGAKIAWWEADNVTMNGGNVASFGEKWGSGKHLVAPTSGNEGALTTLGGQPAVTMAGLQGYKATSLVMSNFILWIVLTCTSTGGRFIYQHGDANYGSYLYSTSSTSYVARLGTASLKVAVDTAWITSMGNAVIRKEYGGSNASHLLHVNRALVNVTNPTQNANTPFSVTRDFTIGCDLAFSNFMQGKFAAAIAIPHTTDTAVIALFDTYLKKRYGTP